ncbi:RagB/SusD family nutrient uptake outer membrane protein [Limibacter armeniacum]|uniref:RagB/SusD family nutrient uptake outer membrane protein n=1 Tax=Limibacter armeniacum TaxID=466084 RepID=UPI002FE64D50
MIRNKWITGLLGLSLWLSACDDYLDIEPKGKTTLETADDYGYLLANSSSTDLAYNIGNLGYLTSEQWPRTVSMVTDLTYPLIQANFLCDETIDRAYFQESDALYTSCYKRIALYNVILDNVSESDGTDAKKKAVIAEAKILRAFEHFVLVNNYAKHYDASTASSDLGIIIRDEFNLETTPPQRTVQEVYDFILKDIEEALPELTDEPMTTFRGSIAMGYALKAKVMLFMKRWDEALAAAEESLVHNDYLFDMVNYYLNKVPAKVDVDMEENLLFRYGGTSFGPYLSIISPEVIERFGEGDTRLLAFFRTSPAIPEGLYAYFTFYSQFQFNVAGMRTPEVYLMKAECLARKGQVAEAMDIVNEIRMKRIVPESYVAKTATSVQEAMQIIIDERASELLFTFNRFWDLRRLNTESEYAQTLVREYEGATYTLKPNSPLYIQPFAQSAVDRHPDLKQNY